MRSNHDQMAVFIDIEALLNRLSEHGLVLDLKPLYDKFRLIARPVINHSFGDIEMVWTALYKKTMSDQPAAEYQNSPWHHHNRRYFRRMLANLGIQHTDIPYMSSQKNSADLRLAVEAISCAALNKAITHVAIVGLDCDYRPVMAKLRELNVQTIGVDINETTIDPAYKLLCDHLFYLDNLPGNSEPAVGSGDDTMDDRRDTYRQVVLTALRNATGSSVLQSRIILDQARKLVPDFEPMTAGFPSIDALLEDMLQRKLIQTGKTAAGADGYSLPLPPIDAPATVPRFTGPTLEATVHGYRRWVEGRQKAPILSVATRKSICEFIVTLLPRHPAPSERRPFTLRQLSDEVTHHLDISTTAVYKMLLALFRQRAFYIDQSLPLDSFNPTIVGISRTELELEDLYVLNCLYTLQRDFPSHIFSVQALAEAFWEDASLSDRIEDALS